MAGIIGNNSARPRLSPSAISAICCAAKAGSQLPRVEKMAPAIAVPTMEVDSFVFSVEFVEAVRPVGRFWRERREVAFEVVNLVGLGSLGDPVFKHFALIMTIVAMVDAIDDN